MAPGRRGELARAQGNAPVVIHSAVTLPISSPVVWFINFISCLQHMHIPPWTVVWGLGVLAKQVVDNSCSSHV
jgi:hypothetical protein